jgi:phosphoribosyl 1,2-cyclic phosphodiesterase
VSLSVTFWGTRGSIPSPGPGTAKFGGNTACLTVGSDGQPPLILDAGTGIRQLGRSLATAADPTTDLTILLSHTHWDHIQGLPFFEPLYRSGTTVRILGPKQPVKALEQVVSAQMDPAVFPVPIAALAATLVVTEFESLDQRFNGLTVRAVPLCHPGATVGFSVQDVNEGLRLSYLTDNELGGPEGAQCRARLVRFLRGTHTLVVHDAMYLEHELPGRVGWGHSSAGEAAALALEAECRRLVLFHHHPDRDDQALQSLLDEARQVAEARGGDCEILIAAEGMTLRC